jgi:hypothetical protein
MQTKTIEDFFSELKNELPETLRHKMIIDQINVVASKIRQWNRKV